jgi:hypothetical protein
MFPSHCKHCHHPLVVLPSTLRPPHSAVLGQSAPLSLAATMVPRDVWLVCTQSRSSTLSHARSSDSANASPCDASGDAAVSTPAILGRVSACSLWRLCPMQLLGAVLHVLARRRPRCACGPSVQCAQRRCSAHDRTPRLDRLESLAIESAVLRRSAQCNVRYSLTGLTYSADPFRLALGFRGRSTSASK